MKKLPFLLMSLLAISLPVQAQAEYEPIHMGGYGFYETLLWSHDSTRLTFPISDLVYVEYDLITQTLTENVNPSPDTITFNDEQRAYFHTLDDVAYVAPNGWQFIYATEFEIPSFIAGGLSNVLAFGEIQPEYAGSYDLLNIEYGFAGYRVRWSADSSAVVVIVVPPYGNGYYLDYVRPHDGQYIVLSFATLDFTTLFDINADGTRLLLPTQDLDRGLVLWTLPDVLPTRAGYDADNDTVNLFEDGVAGAAFEDDEHLLLVSEAGIVRYTLTTQETEAINSDINSTWIRYAQFSPDHRYVAAASNDAELYVLAVDAE
ncbi:MAG: hypothetical protein U0694_16715 [Anaerolineae bacterium]